MALATGGALVAGSGAAHAASGFTVHITPDSSFGLLLDMSGGSTSPGGGLIQWYANGGANQSWSVCRDALDEACRRAGFTPDVVSETNDYQAMLGLVEAGVGIAVVPRMFGALARPQTVAIRPLSGSRLERVVSVACRTGVATTPAMDAMRSLLGEARIAEQPELHRVRALAA